MPRQHRAMQDKHIHDAVIIGAGAAGTSCAVWLARLGFAPLLIEAGPQVGGLCLVHPFPDDWNASLPSHTGPQVAENFAISLQRAKVPLLLSQPVTAVEVSNPGFVVTTSDGSQWRGRHVVLATGTRARGLHDAPDDASIGRSSTENARSGAAVGPHNAKEARFGSGPVCAAGTYARERPFPGVLVGPGDHIVAENFAGRRVAVLGGGDNGFENALYAMDHGAAEVHIYARSVRAQRQFVRRMPAGQVFQGDYQVDPRARTVNGHAYDLILVFYGWEPCVGFAENLGLARSKRGYIDTNMATAQTSCAGVYAIGEVAQRFHPCVVTGMADGVTAAKAIQGRIEAGR